MEGASQAGKAERAGAEDPSAPEHPEDLGADFLPHEETVGGAGAGEAEIDPYQRDSLHAEQAFDQANAAADAGDKERAVREYLRAAKIAETAREWYLAAVSLQRVGQFLESPKPPADLERAYRTYRRAVAAYEQCGLFAEARRLAYRVQCLKMRRAGEAGLAAWARAELFVYWLTAGFGYRPLRIVVSAAVAVLLYGVLYWASGGAIHAASGTPGDFWQSVYFSGITFATVGYGDFVPAAHARLLALTEGAVGAFTMGFFVVVLANRLRH